MVTQIHALNFLLSSGAAQRVALRRKKCPNHPLYGFFFASPAVGVMPHRSARTRGNKMSEKGPATRVYLRV